MITPLETMITTSVKFTSDSKSYLYIYLLFCMRPNQNLDSQTPQTGKNFKTGTSLIVVVIRTPLVMNQKTILRLLNMSFFIFPLVRTFNHF